RSRYPLARPRELGGPGQPSYSVHGTSLARRTGAPGVGPAASSEGVLWLRGAGAMAAPAGATDYGPRSIAAAAQEPLGRVATDTNRTGGQDPIVRWRWCWLRGTKGLSPRSLRRSTLAECCGGRWSGTHATRAVYPVTPRDSRLASAL